MDNMNSSTKLDKIASVFSRLQAKDLTVLPHLCVRLRSPKATCRACEAACPHGVIDWANGLSIDLDLCNECGLCASACMNGVLILRAAEGEGPESKHRARADSETLFVTCRKAQASAGNVTRLPCIGAIVPSMISHSVLAGYREIVLIDPCCTGCADSSGKNIAREFADRYRLTIIDETPDGSAAEARVLPGAPPVVSTSAVGAPDLSRRNFLGHLGEIAGDQVIEDVGRSAQSPDPAPGVLESGPLTRVDILKKTVPEKRERLLRDLLALHAAGRVAEIDSLLGRLDAAFYELSVDIQSCDLCDQCSLLCPTGALDKVSGQRLELFIPFCTGCNLCSDICPRDAIAIEPAQLDLHTLVETRVLVSGTSAICGSCGQSFVVKQDSADRCPRCSAAGQLDDGYLELLDL